MILQFLVVLVAALAAAMTRFVVWPTRGAARGSRVAYAHRRSVVTTVMTGALLVPGVWVVLADVERVRTRPLPDSWTPAALRPFTTFEDACVTDMLAVFLVGAVVFATLLLDVYALFAMKRHARASDAQGTLPPEDADGGTRLLRGAACMHALSATLLAGTMLVVVRSVIANDHEARAGARLPTPVASEGPLTDQGSGARPTHVVAHDCDRNTPPAKVVSIGQPFELHCRESATVKDAHLTLTIDSVDYSPMQSLNGLEIFPWSVFAATVRCGDSTKQVRFNQGACPHQWCGYEVRLTSLSGEDDATFVVARPGAVGTTSRQGDCSSGEWSGQQ